MKIITLIEGSKENLYKMITLATKFDKSVLSFDTEGYNSENEYDAIITETERFLKSPHFDTMIGRFSGREEIARVLGDDFSNMIFIMSYNKYSKYYTECPVSTFSDLLNLFEKETTKRENIEYAYDNSNKERIYETF